MKKILIHYYSATGNTARAVQIMTKELTQAGYSVDIVSVGKTMPAVLKKKYDCHIIAFPVLAWAPPSFVRVYVRSLPRGDKAQAVVFATFGGGPAGAVEQMERLLRRRKYDVLMTAGAAYPDNWTQMMDPPFGTERERQIKKGDEEVRRFLKDFKQGKRRFFRAGLFTRLLHGPVAFMFGLLGRRFLGKCFIADSRCSNCGICVRSCPAGTIRFQGSIRRKPLWLFNCEDCNRCINVCPQNAIQTSVFRLALNAVLHILIAVAVLSVSPSLIRLIHGVCDWPAAFLPDAAGIGLIAAVLFWVQFYCIDRLLFFLEQLAPLRRFFEFSFTRGFRRYTAPGFNPFGDKDR